MAQRAQQAQIQALERREPTEASPQGIFIPCAAGSWSKGVE